MLRIADVNKSTAVQQSKFGMRALLVCIAIATLGQSTGCGIKDATMLTYRDTVWAKRAYNMRYGNSIRKHGDHFERGFRAGYAETCDGGDGYVPALPPENYRTYEYQSAAGAECVNAWFEGYPAGVAAAKKDKSGKYHDVLISKMIDSAIAQSKTEPKLPGQVKVVSTDRKDKPVYRKETGNAFGSGVQSAPANMPAPTYDAPPQASNVPLPISGIAPANYSMNPEMSQMIHVGHAAGFNQPFNNMDNSRSIQAAGMTPPYWDTSGLNR